MEMFEGLYVPYQYDPTIGNAIDRRAAYSGEAMSTGKCRKLDCPTCLFSLDNDESFQRWEDTSRKAHEQPQEVPTTKEK